MRVSHGMWMQDGRPSKNRKVTITLDGDDPLFLSLVDMMKSAIDGLDDGRARTLRHIEAEVKFIQEDVDMYRPESMRVEGVWGPGR